MPEILPEGEGQENPEVIVEKKEEVMSTTKMNFTLISLTVALSTILIIISGYIFANRIIESMTAQIQNLEYTRVGGEENYKLLREIQRDQISNYIKDLSDKDPKYIEGLKRKIGREERKEKVLTPDEVDTLRSDTAILGNSGSVITLIEYSNFLCPFCREFHQANVLKDLMSEQKDTLSIIFKNIPSKEYPESKKLSEIGHCVFALSGSGKYQDYIDKVFSQSGGIDDEKSASKYTQELGIKDSTLSGCLTSTGTLESLDKEFGQSIFLGIKSTPSTVILNNKTGKYDIIEGNVTKEDISKGIESLK